MYKILRKEKLNDQITLMEIEAPYVARKVQAGQFIILRISELGERIHPLTIFVQLFLSSGTFHTLGIVVLISLFLWAKTGQNDRINTC